MHCDYEYKSETSLQLVAKTSLRKQGVVQGQGHKNDTDYKIFLKS